MEQWLKAGEYLPEILRDFHNQKDLFKRLGRMVHAAQQKSPNDFTIRELPNWIAGHIYVIDYFLWFMARRGYTLQRSRKQLDFVEYWADMNEWRQNEREQLAHELTKPA